jgi:predicted RNase H-like HicB family nuclease
MGAFGPHILSFAYIEKWGVNYPGVYSDNNTVMFLTIEISKSDEIYNARCVELEIKTTADTAEKAMDKLKKIIDFYMAAAREDIHPSRSVLHGPDSDSTEH